MRKEELNIYEINELSEESKEKAIEHYRNNLEYFWTDDAIESLKKLLELFRARINDYSLCPYSHSYIDIEFFNEDLNELKNIRLYKWIENNLTKTKGQYGYVLEEWDNCPLTGYCGDYDVLEPVINFMKNPTNISMEDLLQQCADACKNHIIKDMEHQNTDEYIIEHIEANNYEFLANGERY